MAPDPSTPFDRARGTTGRPVRHDPGSVVERLRLVLRQRLDHRLDGIDSGQPSIAVLGVSAHDSALLARGRDEPEQTIVGFSLPAQYQAIGVLANSVVTTPPRRDHRNGAIAVGVTRAGDVVSMLATGDGLVETSEPRGWLVDACLRSVDLPTPPADVSPLAFGVAVWLDRLMVAILNAPAGRPIMWHDAVALCPVPRRWRSLDPVDLGATLASTTMSWSTLRSTTAQGRRAPVGVTRAQAAWMDDSMFARWCMGGFPDLAGLRGDVEFLAPSDVAEHVETALRSAWSAFAG